MEVDPRRTCSDLLALVLALARAGLLRRGPRRADKSSDQSARVDRGAMVV